MENKPSQPCLQLLSSSMSEPAVSGDPSEGHWRNCCLDPSFLPFESGSFVSTRGLEHSWLLKTASWIGSRLSQENDVITRRGMVFLC